MWFGYRSRHILHCLEQVHSRPTLGFSTQEAGATRPPRSRLTVRFFFTRTPSGVRSVVILSAAITELAKLISTALVKLIKRSFDISPPEEMNSGFRSFPRICGRPRVHFHFGRLLSNPAFGGRNAGRRSVVPAYRMSVFRLPGDIRLAWHVRLAVPLVLRGN